MVPAACTLDVKSSSQWKKAGAEGYLCPWVAELVRLHDSTDSDRSMSAWTFWREPHV